MEEQLRMSYEETLKYMALMLTKEQELLAKFIEDPDAYYLDLCDWEKEYGRAIGTQTEYEVQLYKADYKARLLEFTVELETYSDYMMEETVREQTLLLGYMDDPDEYQESVDKWEQDHGRKIDEPTELELEVLSQAQQKMIEKEEFWELEEL